MDHETRRCTGCQGEKSVDDFSVRGHKDGRPLYRSRCKECQAEQARGWYRDNKERANERRRGEFLRERYGITENAYAALLEKQNGVCAICEEPETSERGGKPVRLSVDHCHVTGRVRGLLCHRCNRAIGLIKDSSDRLHLLIAYLSR